jgi:hypothetical protein
MKPEVIDQMLDTILQWKQAAQTWEHIAHQLANSIKTQPELSQKQIDAIKEYDRQLRRKYRTKPVQ